MRTDARTLHDDAVSVMLDVFASCGLASHAGVAATRSELVVEGPVGTVMVEVKAVSVADPTRVSRLIDAARAGDSQATGDRVHMLVSDEIPEASRSLLRDKGWGYFDRRGRLWFTAPGIHVNDTDLAPVPRHGLASRTLAMIAGRVGLSAAVRLLMQPDRPVGVRELA